MVPLDQRENTYVVAFVQIKHKHMTPKAAYEHVRSIRPRVLLGSSQWQVTDFCLWALSVKGVLFLFFLPLQQSRKQPILFVRIAGC